MQVTQNTLNDLASRARRGDQHALALLQKELEPYVGRIVRRAISAPSVSSPLEQRVRSMARRMSGPDAPPARPASQGLVDRVTRGIFDSLVGYFRRAGAQRRPLEETVRF